MMNQQETVKNFNKHLYYMILKYDARWKLKRKEILLRDKNRCVLCGSTSNLVIHHRRYIFIKSKNRFIEPWNYSNKTLITLCENCHKQGHHLYKVPIKYI